MGGGEEPGCEHISVSERCAGRGNDDEDSRCGGDDGMGEPDLATMLAGVGG
jgi:hypothetical protein